ncbi:MAG: hypothetical protein ACRDWN_02095 [Acidimicrobiales bacterium]
MRQFGLHAGIAANPDTPFEAIEPHLDGVDVVLCNGEPGLGRQLLMAEVVSK